MHPFEQELSVSAAELEFWLRGWMSLPWADYELNPRRLRGSDFLMRWSQGVWSEERLVQAVADTGRYFALPYGPSGTAPDHDVRAFELYFERLEAAGLGKLKRPDLLIFREQDRPNVVEQVGSLGGVTELPFTSEDHPAIQSLLRTALIAIECENSLWRAKQMPDFGATLKPQTRLGGKLGLKKSAVLPTVIIKEEDLRPLNEWQQKRGVPIHVWHAFFDLAYGLPLAEAARLISSGLIEGTTQVFQAPGGATTRKTIYKFYHQYAYELAVTVEEPRLLAESITDKNGHILPYVRFQGGSSRLAEAARRVLDQAATNR